MTMKVSFVALGIMGKPRAKHWQGIRWWCHDRNPEAIAASLQTRGSTAKVAEQCDVIITMLTPHVKEGCWARTVSSSATGNRID